MDRRRFLCAGVLIGGGSFGLATVRAQVVNINDAINKSGRQRMLSQRLAKAYLQLGQSIDTEHSRKILDQSVTQFEQQLAELKGFAPTTENKAVLQETGLAWSAYKTLLTSPLPNAQDARAILKINEDILALAQAATMQLERLSGSLTGRYVNMAGRQRMLSQRMAKFYQALNWGVAGPDARDKLLDARKEFVAAMAQLNSAPKNTPEIARMLELAQLQWAFFDNAINAASATSANHRQLATNVATTSERILEVMEQITGMYEKPA